MNSRAELMNKDKTIKTVRKNRTVLRMSNE